jgi:LacI family transcriptional regulator
MKPHRSVALLIETSNAYARGLLEGIISYVRQQANWSIYLPEQERGAKPPGWLARWQGDGIIARIETEEIAQAVRRTRLPAIDVSAARRVENLPWLETDDREIVRLAVDHLLQRGFRHLAYCGDPGFNWSIWRQDHFVELVSGIDASRHLYQSLPRNAKNYSWNREQKRLAAWLRRLPTPVGIMACYDIKAQQLLDVCRELGIAVPEQAAVIGVDNDRLLCDLASPPLTSVVPNTHRTGYEAAALLDRMMAGEQVPAQAHLISPLGIETRQSTDVLAIDDADVAHALRYIRRHFRDGVNVADVLRVVPLSRRVLENRFRKLLGRTPHQEITRLRIEHVKQLLAETNLSLAEIAHSAAFEHMEYLSVAFKREVGLTPREFRRSARSG